MKLRKGKKIYHFFLIAVKIFEKDNLIFVFYLTSFYFFTRKKKFVYY